MSNLVGKRFHSYHMNGDVKWQGEVIEKIDAERYKVVLFSWITRCENGFETVSTSDMSDWTYYDTDQEMRDAYDDFPIDPYSRISYNPSLRNRSI